MAFHDIRFPLEIERGATGGPTYSTAVVATTGGHERRQGNWSAPRYRWNVGTGLKTEAGYIALLGFFHARMGRLHSFRFRDWSDYTAVAEPLGTGDGVDTTFQLVKRYTSGAYTYDRIISKPVVGTVKVFADTVEQTNGWTVNTSTGIVTFSSAPALNVALTASFEFDVPVRFEEDEFRLSLEDVDIGQGVEINIIEVRE